MTRNREIAEAIMLAQHGARACQLPACVDAREQALRVPGLLLKLAHQRNLLRIEKDASFELNDSYVTALLEAQGKVKALEAAQSSIRAEHGRELEGLRSRARDLQDALTHAQHALAGAQSAIHWQREERKALEARIRWVEQGREDLWRDNRTLRGRIEALSHDLLAVLEDFGKALAPAPIVSAAGGSGKPTPLPGPRFTCVGDRRTWELNQVRGRALQAAYAKRCGVAA